MRDLFRELHEIANDDPAIVIALLIPLVLAIIGAALQS